MTGDVGALGTVVERVLDDHRRGDSQRDCIEGLGWVWACWCMCDWHGPDRDHRAHVAAEILRALGVETRVEKRHTYEFYGRTLEGFGPSMDPHRCGHPDEPCKRYERTVTTITGEWAEVASAEGDV